MDDPVECQQPYGHARTGTRTDGECITMAILLHLLIKTTHYGFNRNSVIYSPPPLPHSIVVKKNWGEGGQFLSWEVGGTLPQNSDKPSQDLWEATLKRRTMSVQRLRRSFGTDRQTDRHRFCYFYIRQQIFFYFWIIFTFKNIEPPFLFRFPGLWRFTVLDYNTIHRVGLRGKSSWQAQVYPLLLLN